MPRYLLPNHLPRPGAGSPRLRPGREDNGAPGGEGQFSRGHHPRLPGRLPPLLRSPQPQEGPLRHQQTDSTAPSDAGLSGRRSGCWGWVSRSIKRNQERLYKNIFYKDIT